MGTCTRTAGIIAIGLATACTDPTGRGSSGYAGVGIGDGGDTASESSGSEGDASGTTAAALDDVSEYVLALGHLDVDDLLPKTQTACTGECPIDGPEGQEVCAYVHYSETVHAQDFVAFQPNSATLWPGNVVQGDDARRGLLTPIGLPRAPMTFSVSLENLQGSPVGSMESPSLSSFREQRNMILAAGVDGAVPAQISYEISQVFDESQVAVDVGGSLDWAGVASVAAMFGFAESHSTTKVLVEFTQAYYTIDVDIPGLPSDFFTDDVGVAELETFTGPDNPPMYVQSITYGRRVIFSLESLHSEQDIRFALEASFDALLYGGGVDIDIEHRQVLDESKISAVVLGGAGSDAVKTVFGIDGLFQYLVDGGDYSKDSPGAPIAYKLAYLDNTGVEFAFTTDYSERQCYDNFIDVSGQLARLDYLGGNDDGDAGVNVNGTIMFRVAPPGEADPCRADAPGWQVVFDRDGDGPQDVWGMWVPTTPIVKTIYDFEVAPEDALCIRGRLGDTDDCWFCDDDSFGETTLGPLKLAQGWAGDHVLDFNDQGTVVATVRIAVD